MVFSVKNLHIFFQIHRFWITVNAEPWEPENTPSRQSWRNGRLKVKVSNARSSESVLSLTWKEVWIILNMVKGLENKRWENAGCIPYEQGECNDF